MRSLHRVCVIAGSVLGLGPQLFVIVGLLTSMGGVACGGLLLAGGLLMSSWAGCIWWFAISRVEYQRG